MTAAQPRLADPAARALAAAQAGTGSLLLVTGPAGAGKTRVAHLLHDAARSAELTTCWAVCGRAGAPPFWPWVQVLRALPGTVNATHPLARQLLDASSDAGPADLRARFELFDDVTALLAEAAYARPTVVLLDDLHEADAASLLLLEHVSAVLRSMPLLVAATVRTDVQPPLPEWATAWPALVRRGDALSVGPMPRAEIAALLEEATGSAAPALVSRIEQRTGGNALFVCELVRLCATSGGDVDALPPTVRAVIAARVAERSGECRRLLSLAATYGSSAPVSVLAGLLGEEVDVVLAGVDEAVRFGLIERRAPEHVAFVHDIVRDAVYDGLPAAHRAHWHRGIADRFAIMGEAANAAHHYRLAGPDAHSDAADWFARAGEDSLAMLAYEDAAAQFAAALDCGPALPGRVQVRLGAALLATGDAAGARAAHLAAVEAGRTSGDADLLAAGALGLGAGPAGFEIALQDREQIAALEDALDALGAGGTPAARSALMARLSIALTLTDSVERRTELAEEAVRLARVDHDERSTAIALASLADVLAGPEHCARRLAMAGDIVETALRLRDSSLELLGRRHRIEARFELGDIAGVEDDIAAYRNVASALQQPLYAWYVPLWQAALALARGELALADERLAEADRIGSAAGSANAAALVPSHIFTRAGELHDAALMRAIATDPVLTNQAAPWVPISLAHARAASGDVSGARAELAGIEERVAALPRDSEWLPTLAQAVEAVVAVGGHPVARPLYELLLPYAELFVVEGIGAALRGCLHRHLGMLAAVLGERASAEEHFAAALAANERIGARLIVACTLRDAGTLLGDPERQRDAAAMLAQLGVGTEAVQGEVEHLFRRDGETWTLAFAGRRVTVRDSKGLRDLATLLGSPGRAVPAVDLVTSRDAQGRGTGDASLHEPGDLGELLDETARRAYRERLRDLEEDAAEADAQGDIERSARVAAERDAIVAELGAAYGLAGRPRRSGSPVERARTTVTARIRDTIRRIAAVHPELGRHLSVAIRTGTLCSYEPEQPLAWQLTP